MQRIPESRASAEAAVEAAVGELLASRGGEVGFSPKIYIRAFWPLASFLYSEEVLTLPPSADDEQSLTQALTDIAQRVVDAIVSPLASDPLTPDVPHDEWWRFAPHGIKTLALSERTAVRDLLQKRCVERELPYWVHRLKTQAAPVPEPHLKSERASWQQTRDRFHQDAIDHPDLLAHWDSRQELWTLREVWIGGVQQSAKPDAVRLFKETARVAAGLLGKSAAEKPSWHVWLDLMRNSKRGFSRITKVPWRVFRIAAEGGIPDTSAFPVSDDGTIAHVFAESADFCADLDARRQGSEVASDDSNGPENAAGGRGRSQEMRQGLEDEFKSALSDVLDLHKPDGRVFAGIAARVSAKAIMIMDISLLIEIGDRLIRTLPNGLKDEFIVEDPGYQAGLPAFGVPAHFQVKVRRADRLIEESSPRTTARPAPMRAPAVPDADGQATGRPSDDARGAKESRAMIVAKLIKELNALRPQMFEDEKEYDKLRAQHPDFLAFRIAEQRRDLKLKLLSIRGSTRHIRLAQELAAAHYGRQLSTIQDDWKDYKPSEFRRPK